MSLTITFPDGSEREYDSGVTGAEVAASIGPRLAKAAVAVKLDGAAIDLGRAIDQNGTVERSSRRPLKKAATSCGTPPPT